MEYNWKKVAAKMVKAKTVDECDKLMANYDRSQKGLKRYLRTETKKYQNNSRDWDYGDENLDAALDPYLYCPQVWQSIRKATARYVFEYKTFIVEKDFERMNDDYVRSGGPKEYRAGKYMKPYPIYKVLKRTKNGRVKKVIRRFRMRGHRRTSP